MRKLNKYDIDDDILPKVLNVLDLIIQFSSKKKASKKNYSEDVYSILKTNQCKDTKHMGKYCLDLVIKSISNYRYEEAAKLYWILCQDKSILEHVLFKVGIIILLNLESNDKDCFLNFFRSMLNFSFLNKKETLLEFVMCAIKCEFPDIQREVKELANRKVMSKVRKHEKIDSILDAYILLLEWCNVFCGDMNMSQSQTNKEVVKLNKYNEDSDIFILKLIKMMNLCDKQNEVENELLNYVESNPDSVNALIYICTYLYHNHPDSDNLIKYLEILAEKCISDVRTLWLIKIWRKRGVNLYKILNYCFMFLDYPTNGENIEAWKALFKSLRKAQQKLTEENFKNIHSLWESRKRSWSWMYFNPQQLSNMKSNNKLIAYKVAFLLLFAEGKKYIEKVSEYHPDSLELAESLRN